MRRLFVFGVLFLIVLMAVSPAMADRGHGGGGHFRGGGHFGHFGHPRGFIGGFYGNPYWYYGYPYYPYPYPYDYYYPGYPPPATYPQPGVYPPPPG